MLNKVINFLYNFDIIGPSPKLYIFNKERYQSIFSLILSVLIIFLTIIFILYSLINYIENERPTVLYSKSNDKNEKREMYLNESLIMLQLVDFNTFKKLDESIAYLNAEDISIYDTGESETLKLKAKHCKLGENLNSRYEEYFKERFSTLSFEYNQYDKNIEDFYCINNDNNDKSLFFYPNIGYNNININIIIKNQDLYTPENISLMLIYENNLINHDDKESPISEGISYQFIQGFSSNENTIANYNFQYLKYETDDGLFFNSVKYLKGISFLDMNYHRIKQSDYNLQNNFIKYNSSNIGTIILTLNKSNYDYYRRTYKKLQALLAEIMSIVSLLIEIGRQILEFSTEKKMSVDIIRTLFGMENHNKLKSISKKFYINDSDRIKIAPEKMNNSFKLDEKNNSNSIFESINNETVTKNEIILKKINFLNVVKSFCCFKSDKDKLIELCHDIIVKDMCVETILQRFYNLNRIYDAILDIEKYNLGLNKDQRFREINNIINIIYNQSKKSYIKKNNNK